uniref:Uncharacterized protein n=1 Tax=Chromera velia CCMP2878 TaxID=1169474 RepID=A0A0G4FDX2_9ALVE|eukprot:Cvel_16409.t1-p1 / transcript=Cvel_16409.t1 / gene=Cvel_16409 / organism=Chromera_velia_CCMP2878 / gene_product=hypothetical protein / transcript_product=hypothetical protein / location=Cvel_scaffold1263:17209-20170(-) / protein_length=84 / sequence_SO=supercontig / SO=protein_coding / is_pseudo=false
MCAGCCGLLSITGVIILGVWGTMLVLDQPEIEVAPGTDKVATGFSCYIAVAMYAATAAGCFWYLRKQKQGRASRSVAVAPGVAR